MRGYCVKAASSRLPFRLLALRCPSCYRSIRLHCSARIRGKLPSLEVIGRARQELDSSHEIKPRQVCDRIASDLAFSLSVLGQEAVKETPVPTDAAPPLRLCGRRLEADARRSGVEESRRRRWSRNMRKSTIPR